MAHPVTARVWKDQLKGSNQMDNVLQDMVQRLRAIELLLRTQNELLTRVFDELEQNRRCAEASGVRPAPGMNMPGKLRAR